MYVVGTAIMLSSLVLSISLALFFGPVRAVCRSRPPSFSIMIVAAVTGGAGAQWKWLPWWRPPNGAAANIRNECVCSARHA